MSNENERLSEIVQTKMVSWFTKKIEKGGILVLLSNTLGIETSVLLQILKNVSTKTVKNLVLCKTRFKFSFWSKLLKSYHLNV